MADISPNRRALHEQWQKNVEVARLRLQFARAFVEEVRADLRRGAIPSPDGDYAYRRAVRAETAALAEYRRVFRLFTDLLYRNQIPEDAQPDTEPCAEKQDLEGRLRAIIEEIGALDRAQMQAIRGHDRLHYEQATMQRREACQRRDILLNEYRQHLRLHRC